MYKVQEKMNLYASNGIKIPEIFCGTDYRTLNNEELTKEYIYQALKAGFRAIDTAWMYRNEHLIKEVLEKCYSEGWLNRSDIFLQSKVSHIRQGYNYTLEIFQEHINKLGTDYLRLFNYVLY